MAIVLRILLIGLSSFQSCIAFNRSHIFRDVIDGLDPDIAPFQSINTSIDVIIMLTLSEISEINERQKTMTISYGIGLTWQDYRLKWNASLYQGISSVQVKASKIWTPSTICISNEVRKEKCIGAREGQVTAHSQAYASYINSMENKVHFLRSKRNVGNPQWFTLQK
ncbi:acetylcholine receptor subunit gamma-like [Saccostrea echinata]|uniref:acetylcholine receptor subunit gamma-like n=1 Tax=Saccostrea echinata TaxID=191078 RepID=UPI002A802762|nr:acetylcholine receptor subunit gamma-like [Saccostrea echinata]